MNRHRVSSPGFRRSRMTTGRSIGTVSSSIASGIRSYVLSSRSSGRVVGRNRMVWVDTTMARSFWSRQRRTSRNFARVGGVGAFPGPDREGVGEDRQGVGAAIWPTWMTRYYQYANRLAHLHFLRDVGVSASLLFNYFSGDVDVQGPKRREECLVALEAIHRSLGLAGAPDGNMNCFVDVDWLR